MWTRALNKFRQPCPWLKKKSLSNTGFKWGQIISRPGGGSTCLGAGPGTNPHGTISWVHKNIQDK
jgi:hypothetical protein